MIVLGGGVVKRKREDKGRTASKMRSTPAADSRHLITVILSGVADFGERLSTTVCSRDRGAYEG